jgi:PAS domain S-box-containing protein
LQINLPGEFAVRIPAIDALFVDDRRAMNVFASIYRKITSLPVLWSTERELRRAKTLHTAYLFILIAGVAYATIPASILASQTILTYCVLGYSLIGIMFLRLGHLRISSLFSIGVLWVIFSYGAYTEGGITSIMYAVNMLIIVFAGMVFGLRGAFGVAVLSVTAGFVDVYLASHNLLPPAALVNTQSNLISDYTVYFFFTALFTGLSVDHMDQSSTVFEHELVERKRSEEASVLARGQLKSVFDAVTEISIVATNVSGVITIFNSGAEKMLGYTADEVVGRMSPFAFHLESEMIEHARKLSQDYQTPVSPADVFRFLPKLGKNESREWTYVRKDGSQLTVNIDITAVRDEHGEVIGYLGAAVDITEKKAIADALRKSEEQYRLLLENMNEVVMLVDNDDRVLFVNRRFSELLGYEPEEILGRIGYEVLVHANDRMVIKKAIEERKNFFHNQYELEFITKRGDKIPFLVNGSPLIDPEGRVIGSIGTLTDISYRKVTEDALKKSERLLRDSQEVARIGYYLINFKTRRWESSPVLNDIVGIDDSFTFDLRHGTALVAPQFRRILRDHFYAALRFKRRLEFDCQIIRQANNEVRWVSAKGEIEYTPSGRPVQMLGTIQDITDRKRLESQLIQAQKLEGVGTLAGGIAHDFNNLLAMILGSAELMRQHIAHHPRLKKYVDRIIEASERGSSISRQLLIFSRPEQAELKPISLSHTINELEGMLKHFLPKSIVIETAIDVDDAMIIGDAGQIHQALLNLSLNAADAMTNTGRLTIKEFCVPPEVMNVKYPYAQPVTYVAIAVSDTGVGMEPAMMGKIFDPFYSTKEKGKGTGLGLAIVHGIVKSHSGFIDVQSILGEGTTFTLYFPSVPRRMQDTLSVLEHSFDTQSGVILLVEDEETLREMLHESLTDLGYTVHTASNGTEAVAIYSTHHASIDLVITDMGMPEMGGEELYGNLKRIHPGVKVLVASGYLDGTTKAQLLRLGIRDVLSKPFKMREIHTAIRKALDSTE